MNYLQPIIELAEKRLTLERNQYLKVGGSMDTNIYYVETGSLRMYVLDAEEEQIIRFGYQGNLIVALDCFLTNKPSALYIQALKKTTVAVITKSRFNAFIQESAAQQSLWSTILQDLVLQQLEREVDILTASPKERYRRVLERSPRLFQEIPLRYIANYLRMSPETLSRLKKS